MKIELGCFEYKLSKAQESVVKTLIKNESSVVCPSIYHNHQSILLKNPRGIWEHNSQFTKPTLKWLRDRKILIPIAESEYPRLKLNPLVKVV